MAKTLTLRLTDDQSFMIDDLLSWSEIENSNIRTSSKLCIAALEAFRPQFDELTRAQATIDRQQLEIERLRGVIEGARSAASLLMDKTSQGDLLGVEGV